MLSSYLETKCKVYHAPADADVLNVHKTLESAILMDTALVGDDTDLLILFYYISCLIIYSFFRTWRKMQRSWKSGTSRLSRSNWVLKYAMISFFCMQSLDVILLHTCMVSERAHLSRNTFKVFAKESATPKEIFIAGEQALVTLHNETPGESL